MTVRIDTDGVKVDDAFMPFVEDYCGKCKFARSFDAIQGVDVNATLCTMTPEQEDYFLFNDVADDKLPACMKAE